MSIGPEWDTSSQNALQRPFWLAVALLLKELISGFDWYNSCELEKKIPQALNGKTVPGSGRQTSGSVNGFVNVIAHLFLILTV